MNVHEHTLSLIPHPAGTPIEFTWKPDQTIEAWVKTSTAGPGYHHFMVELLNRLGEEMGLQWDWDGADESDYAVTWNYDRLQLEMAEFLQLMARHFLDRDAEGYSDMAVNMPLDGPRTKGEGFVVSPLGPLPGKWWLDVCEADENQLIQLAEEFYPWWDREQDAEFYKRAGLVLLWCEVPWHPPVDDRERKACQQALDCLLHAGTSDAAMELPKSEMRELRELLTYDVNLPAPVPLSEGIGYRRRKMTWPVTGDWTVDLPGYYYQQLEDDGSNVVFWFNDRTVHVSSLSATRRDGRPAAPREMLPEKKPEDIRGAEIVDLEKDHLAGWAAIRPAEQDGVQYWQLQGTMATGNTMAIATVCYDDPDDKQWAIETFKSLSHPEPESTL